MSQALKYDVVSFDDYLAGERDVAIRSEYVDGKIYAMAGASETHNTIAGSFYAPIENALADDCRAWQSDMKVIGEHNGNSFSYYPDIMAACGENTGDQYVRDNPILIIEVLSPSTERIDRREKFDNYTNIPTLVEYVLVSQKIPLIEVFRRRNDWQQEHYCADDRIVLESIALELEVKHIYRRVKKEVGLIVNNH